MVGVVAAVELRLLVPMLVSWFLVLVICGYVSLATMLSGVALVVAVCIFEPNDVPLLSFCSGVALFVVYTHRSNIARLRAGQESRVRRLWLFRSRAA